MTRVMFCFFLLLTLAAAAPGFAQGTALTGRIRDPQGAAVPDAAVRIAREDGAVVRTATTNETGEYRVDGLPSGLFVVEIAKNGFRRRTALVTLSAGAPASLDIDLEVAGIDDAVVVTAAGVPQVTQETSKAVTIIEAQDILARNETTLSEIVRFTPGVQIRNSGGPGQTTSMRIRGLRPDGAAVLVDGMRFRDASTIQADATSFLASLNFVAADRVEVLRGSGSSLYGTNAVGGVVNIVTRSGGGTLRPEAQVEAGSLGHFRTRGSISGGVLGDRLRYSAGALQFNLFDGLDGDDATRSTGGQGMVQYDFSPTTNLMLRVFGSDDRVRAQYEPDGRRHSRRQHSASDYRRRHSRRTRSDRTFQSRVAGPDRHRYLHPGAQRSRQPSHLELPHHRTSVPPQRLVGIELAGELSTRPYAAHVHEWGARRRVPARGGELLGHFRRHPHG